MMFQVVVEFSQDRDPVRSEHGLAKLVDFARWIESQREFEGVRQAAPIVWGCEEPVGFGVYEARDEDELRAFLARLHNTREVRVVPCKPLDEVVGLAGVRIAAMRAEGRPAIQAP